MTIEVADDEIDWNDFEDTIPAEGEVLLLWLPEEELVMYGVVENGTPFIYNLDDDDEADEDDRPVVSHWAYAS